MNEKSANAWFSVRSVFAHAMNAYEERVVIFFAESVEQAIEKAIVEGNEYCALLGKVRMLDLHQAFEISEEIRDGAEIYSLIRQSGLSADRYIDTFFDTGGEYQIKS